MAKKCLMEKAARLWAAKAKDKKRVAEGKLLGWRREG